VTLEARRSRNVSSARDATVRLLGNWASGLPLSRKLTTSPKESATTALFASTIKTKMFTVRRYSGIQIIDPVEDSWGIKVFF